MPYIGNTPTSQSFTPQIDYFNGNDSQVAFTLSRNVASVAQVIVVVNNVPQKPGDAFSVLNNVITFTSAPSAGSNNIYVYYTSLNQSIIQPGFGTVGLNEVTQSVEEAFSGMGFKNRIINGAMMIDQRNAGASVPIASTVFGYKTVDRWQINNQTDGALTIQQSTTAPAGFNNSIAVAVTTADASLGAAQFCFLRQTVEGFNIGDLAFGSASASPITVSFWVRSSVTGAMGGSITNGAVNRSYPFTYLISSANTWEYKTVSLSGDTTGAWAFDNSVGMNIFFSLGSGIDNSGTAGAWTGSQKLSATGATSVVGTSGATFYITGVQLEKGSTATSFDYRPYGTELALCQRYYQFGNFTNTVYGVAGSTNTAGICFKVSMRAVPTMTGTFTYINTNSGGMTPYGSDFATASATVAAAANSLIAGAWTASAEL